MYCKLKGKEVYVYVLKESVIGSKKIQFKDCTGNYKCDHKNMLGKKVYEKCDMARHEECLLNK